MIWHLNKYRSVHVTDREDYCVKVPAVSWALVSGP
jgi:hypothetical protein